MTSNHSTLYTNNIIHYIILIWDTSGDTFYEMKIQGMQDNQIIKYIYMHIWAIMITVMVCSTNAVRYYLIVCTYEIKFNRIFKLILLQQNFTESHSVMAILTQIQELRSIFTKTSPSYGSRNCHYKLKTVWWPSWVYNVNPYTNNTVS